MTEWVYIGVIVFTVLAPMLMAALVDDPVHHNDIPRSSFDL